MGYPIVKIMQNISKSCSLSQGAMGYSSSMCGDHNRSGMVSVILYIRNKETKNKSSASHRIIRLNLKGGRGH